MLVLNDKLMTLPEYSQKLMAIARDSAKFAGIHGSITRKAFLEALEFDLDIQHKIKYICITKPTFAKYTKVDEIYRKLLKLSIPSEVRREKLCELLE